MSHFSYPISVIICTVDRASSLDSTLEAIAKLKKYFKELIVVHGLSQDNTCEILRQYKDVIDISITTELRNVSASRNIGLKAASQEIIMYLDDDVIPFKDWLDSHFRWHRIYGQECACIGGEVRDKSKSSHPLQFSRGVNSILSESRPILSEALSKKYIFKPFWFPAVMGANASYKRNALLNIGSFDEFFEYFLEETDICYRLIKAGYSIYHIDNCVDHYPAKSHNRQDQKHLTCWYSLSKNTTYFALKHALNKIPLPILCIRLAFLLIYRCFLRIVRLKFTHHLSNKLISQYIQESIDGIRVGWIAGMDFHKSLT